MTRPTDFFIDFETLSPKHNATVIDLAVVSFNDEDYENLPTFAELKQRALRIKFRLKDQNRHISKSTLEWWKQQSPEAKLNLVPSDQDVSVEQGVDIFLDFLEKNNVHYWNSHLWARGPDFDVCILQDLIMQRLGLVDNDPDRMPINFSRTRDVRTAIEQNMGQRNVCVAPIKKELLTGFVHHDSVSDVCRDVLMLLMSKRYAFGLEQMPNQDECEPSTVPIIKK